MAGRLKADWLAVYVDTPEINKSDKKRNSAIQNLKLAERLGAATTILSGLNISKEIMEFARKNNITRIVIGKHVRSWWKNLLFGNLANKIIKHSDEIDVYLITGEIDDTSKAPITQEKNIPWRIYGIMFFTIAIITLINYLFHNYINNSSIFMLYLLGVTFIALFESLPHFISFSVI